MVTLTDAGTPSIVVDSVLRTKGGHEDRVDGEMAAVEPGTGLGNSSVLDTSVVTRRLAVYGLPAEARLPERAALGEQATADGGAAARG